MNVVLIVLGVLVLFIFLIFNNLVAKRNQVNNAFSSIDVMLNKRYDLIPNLVAAVKNYMKHEQGTLTEITQLRSKAMSGQVTSDEKVALNNKISKALGGIMVAVENYPDLKASQNFLQLQASLNEVEEQLSASRRAFNAAVTDYHNAIEMFPSNIIASLFNFQRRQWFEVEEAKRGNVNVSDLFKQ